MAARFQVEIIRLPVRHCILNPKELAWRSLKAYIRNNNIRFRLNDIHNLALKYLVALDEQLVTSFFAHALQYEEVFKVADKYVEEEVEPLLQNEEIYDDDMDEDFSSLDL
jgi:hypothetical protein